jgi:sporulation protein YlmC with PRC-barrel domain
MVYTTQANVEAYLRTTFDSTTTPTDTVVQGWIDDVDDEIDRLTGTTFQETTNTEILDLRKPTDRFLVEKYPLINVTSVSKNTSTASDKVFNPIWTEFDNNRAVGDIIIVDETVHAGEAQVKLVYTYGHLTVPPEVEYLATLLVVKKIISSDDTTSGAFNSVSVGGLSITNNVSVSRMANLDNNIQQTLKRIGKYGTTFK